MIETTTRLTNLMVEVQGMGRIGSMAQIDQHGPGRFCMRR